MSTCDLERVYNIKNLFSLEHTFKDHKLLLQSTIQEQREILNRMLVLAQRYTIVNNGISTKRTYPPEAPYQIKDELLTEFYLKLAKLNDSNSKLLSSLFIVKVAFCELSRTLNELDLSFENSLDRCDTILPPISYYFELFADSLKFFNHTQSRLNCFANLLTPDNITSLERYKGILKTNSEFDDHFSKIVAYCNYLHK